MLADINNLSLHNLVAPYKFIGAAALSVDRAKIFFTLAEIAIVSSLPIIFDQYVDNSLSEKNVYQKKKEVLLKHSRQKIKSIESPKILTNSDLIYYLDVVDELNIKAKYY